MTDAPHVAADIEAATIERQVAHGRYEPSPLYGNGHAAERIATVLAESSLSVHKTAVLYGPIGHGGLTIAGLVDAEDAPAEYFTCRSRGSRATRVRGPEVRVVDGRSGTHLDDAAPWIVRRGFPHGARARAGVSVLRTRTRLCGAPDARPMEHAVDADAGRRCAERDRSWSDGGRRPAPAGLGAPIDRRVDVRRRPGRRPPVAQAVHQAHRRDRDRLAVGVFRVPAAVGRNAHGGYAAHARLDRRHHECLQSARQHGRALCRCDTHRGCVAAGRICRRLAAAARARVSVVAARCFHRVSRLQPASGVGVSR